MAGVNRPPCSQQPHVVDNVCGGAPHSLSCTFPHHVSGRGRFHSHVTWLHSVPYGKYAQLTNLLRALRSLQLQGMAYSVREDALYVADTENHALRRIDLKAKTVNTLAGNPG